MNRYGVGLPFWKNAWWTPTRTFRRFCWNPRMASKDRCEEFEHGPESTRRWPGRDGRLAARIDSMMCRNSITVFISYAHEDAEFAQAIQQGLEAAGFTVWIDEGALRAESIPGEMGFGCGCLKEHPTLNLPVGLLDPGSDLAQ